MQVFTAVDSIHWDADGNVSYHYVLVGVCGYAGRSTWNKHLEHTRILTTTQVAATPEGNGDHLQAGDDALEAMWLDVHAVRTHTGKCAIQAVHVCNHLHRYTKAPKGCRRRGSGGATVCAP